MRYSHPTHIRKFNLLVTLDLGSDLVNPVGDLLRGGSTVLTIELDSEIVIGSTGVMGSGQQDPTVRLPRSDHGGYSGGGKDGGFTDDEVLDFVTGSESEDLLDDLGRLLSVERII
jgi:hypothetical protein